MFWMIQVVRCLPAVSSRNFSSSASSHSRAGLAAAASFVGTLGFETRIILGFATRFFVFFLELRNSTMHFLFPFQPASLAGDIVEIPHTSV